MKISFCLSKSNIKNWYQSLFSWLVSFINVKGPANYIVVGCYNCTKKVEKVERTKLWNWQCFLIKDCACVYNPPYRLFKFPNILRNGEKRKVDREVKMRKQRQNYMETLW